MRMTLVLAAATMTTMLTMGCNHSAADGDGPDGGMEATGGVGLFISAVPLNVGCVVVDDVASRVITNTFNVTPGQSARLLMNNLPAGTNVFDAQAYNGACPIAPSAQATWATPSSTVVNILPGTISNLELTLQQVGGANVGLQFGDGGTTD
jgi:hypothetical protein